MDWLINYAETARRTDRFVDRENRAALLAAGLVGEAGSVLAEFKKEERERNAYPAYRLRMVEELGDFLWYFVRFVDVIAPDVLPELKDTNETARSDGLPIFLDFGHAVGELLQLVGTTPPPDMRARLTRVWQLLLAVANAAHVPLHDAAFENQAKITSRWPVSRDYHPLFDDHDKEEEQLPRELTVEFREQRGTTRNVVYLRCNGLNFGDRLTDNVEGEDDGYRFHDVFHFAYAVHLGWSPVIRALLKVKRKTSTKVDEGQDGARAAIIEEAVSAIAFSRAKRMTMFDSIDHVDYDLLKTIQEFVRDFEVARVPLWQWEVAILEGFNLFRKLLLNRGGTVKIDMIKRQLNYIAPHE